MAEESKAPDHDQDKVTQRRRRRASSLDGPPPNLDECLDDSQRCELLLGLYRQMSVAALRNTIERDATEPSWRPARLSPHLTDEHVEWAHWLLVELLRLCEDRVGPNDDDTRRKMFATLLKAAKAMGYDSPKITTKRRAVVEAVERHRRSFEDFEQDRNTELDLLAKTDETEGLTAKDRQRIEYLKNQRYREEFAGDLRNDLVRLDTYFADVHEDYYFVAVTSSQASTTTAAVLSCRCGAFDDQFDCDPDRASVHASVRSVAIKYTNAMRKTAEPSNPLLRFAHERQEDAAQSGSADVE